VAQTGQLIYARVSQEGLRVVVVCEGYPRDQISKDNFIFIERSAGLWMGSQKRGSPLGWSIRTGPKGQLPN